MIIFCTLWRKEKNKQKMRFRSKSGCYYKWSSRSSHGPKKLEYNLRRRGWRDWQPESYSCRNIKLSLPNRNQIPLTQPSLFRDFSGCIPLGVHGFGSIWQQRQRKRLTKGTLKCSFPQTPLQYIGLPHTTVQHGLTFINLNIWSIKLYVLLCLHHQNNGGRAACFLSAIS